LAAPEQEVLPTDRDRCEDTPLERVTIRDSEQGMLEILIGEALAEQARLDLKLESDAAAPNK
jgi:hypothetical protein